MGATGEQHDSRRAVLAESQTTVRDALRVLVTQGLGMQVVDEAGTLQTLQRHVRAHRPDLAIVDWDMLAQSASLLAGLRSCSPGLRIVVIGQPDDAAAGSYALSVGVLGTPGVPMVHLAIEGRDAEGWYPLSTLEVQ